MEALPKNSTQRERKEQVRRLLGQGLKVRQIALLLNLSTQRVYQIRNEIADQEAAS